MKISRKPQFFSSLAGLVLAVTSGSPAIADDTEIFKGAPGLASGVQPNILFIIDTSGSMDAAVTTQIPYDPATTYAGTCAADRVYFTDKDDDPVPDPDGDCEKELDEWINFSALRCQAAIDELTTDGVSSYDFMAQWIEDKEEWKEIDKDEPDSMVECAADDGVHGEAAGDAEVYVAEDEDGPWTDDQNQSLQWGDDLKDEYLLYTGNYINWYYGAQSVTKTRLEIVQDVTNKLIDDLTDVNIGIMRFDRSADGGMVVHAMEDVDTGRVAAKAVIDAMDHGGNTPLSETMYEAALYYRGDAVDFGRDSTGNNYVSMPSVASARTGNGPDGGKYYLSPVPPNSLSCQKNFIVLLTDGAPTGDVAANAKVAGLTGPTFEETTGRTACDGTGDGACLDDIAEYLYKADLNSDISDGIQNVVTYTIGFAVDLPILKNTAKRGGGEYYLADDTVSLTRALTSIVTEVLEDNTTFSAPTLSVNSFNRTQNLDQIFVNVFKAAGRPLWQGNLKKYRLVGDDLVGHDGVTPVVDPATGFFRPGARSIWSDKADGPEVPLGGAANLLPSPGARNVYTYTGGSSVLSNAANHLVSTNVAVTAAMLGLSAGSPERDNLIAWARGQDVDDDDGDDDSLEARRFMGDPLHARPATVVYGGTTGSPDINDAVVYVATNEGFLHAFDASTGSELYAFMPPNLLPNIKANFDNDASQFKGYGLDGTIKQYVIDIDKDGIIEASAGDRVYLFFGMRRGGKTYYALNVTNRNAPELMWMKDDSDWPRLAQTWSEPSITRVEVSGAAQNTRKLVMIVGGGYNTSQDNSGYSTDSSGNAVFMVDALSGALLWSAGPDVTNDLTLSDMTNSIPAGLRVIDMNTDGFADRMYVGDMGGRVWRFDIFSGQTAANLVTGGVMASLGAADLVSPAVADNRRFYNTPDVSFIRRESGNYFNIAIGSGYRAQPLSSATDDRFYALRDYQPFRQLDSTEFATYSASKITDDDLRLEDITGLPGLAPPTVPSGAIGWKMSLPGGEKVLAEARTFEDKVFFTTYTPQQGGGNGLSCAPQRGSNKLYIVDVTDGSPTDNLDGIGSDTTLTIEDRAQALDQTGIAPEVTFFFQGDDGDDEGGGGGGGGGGCPTSSGVTPKCLVGVEKCAADFCNAPVRTFWTQDDATQDE